MTELIIDPEPKIIGLYGVPGSGKSTILRQLQNDSKYSDYLFFEGSEVIHRIADGGMARFKAQDAHDKQQKRCEAIETIRQECVDKDKTTVVAGHFAFWNRELTGIIDVWTPSDAEVFTHIMYLQVPGAALLQQIENDMFRPDRSARKINKLDDWQKREMEGLHRHCENSTKDIALTLIKGGLDSTLQEVKDVLDNTKGQDEKENRDRVNQALKAHLRMIPSKLDAVLLIDGDTTLAPQDTGLLYWESTSRGNFPWETTFKELGYTFAAFQQAAEHYERSVECDDEFVDACEVAATKVAIHPELKRWLGTTADSDSVRAFVVTSGLRRIWEKVLKMNHLSNAVKVFGGGRTSDYVVTPKIKAGIAKALQKNGLYVWAFGDSTLGRPMLQQSDQAIVVVRDLESRSKSMEDCLQKAIDDDGLQARQVLLPSTVPMRLNEEKLPITTLKDLDVMQALKGTFKHVEATKKPAARLLMTPTRDVSVQGPSLREAHRNVGRYLATEYLSAQLGLQQYQMTHVQSGKKADGYRLFHEKKTSIVPLMRGGEAIAFGVSEVFPLAPFLHAKKPEDVEKKHLKGMTNVVLVDAMINTGDSIVEFVKRIRELRPTVRIMVVSGVTQKDAVQRLADDLAGGVTLISLRTSENKFTGRGGTDTGARLFSTTEME